jgi:hypothetical protein
MTRQRLAAFVLALAFAVIAAPVALAGGPNDDEYPDATTLVKKAPKKTPTGSGIAPLTTTKTSGKTLPFTGLDLAFVVVLGASGVVGGVALRKLGQKRSES